MAFSDGDNSAAPADYELHERRRHSQQWQEIRLGARALPKTLPPEITDIIISYVEDRDTLCSCMAVCRDWTPASRAVLLEDITIDCPSSYDLLVHRVIRSECKILRACLTRTRTFRIDTHNSRSVPLAPRFLYDIAGRLPALRTLALGGVDWSVYSPRATEPLLLSQFGQLRRLVLRDCRMPSFNFFRRALTAISSLDELSLFHVTWPDLSPLSPIHSSSHKGPALRRLSVHFAVTDAAVDTLLLWLGQLHSPSSISHLLFFAQASRSSARYEVNAIALRSDTLNRLMALGSCMHLTTLKVNMNEHLPLSVFPNVHTLFIYADAFTDLVSYQTWGPSRSPGKGFWERLVLMLRDTQFYLRRLYVRNVARELLIGHTEDIINSDQADTILSQLNFEDMEFVHFTTSATMVRHTLQMTNLIQSRLPRLHSRGILKVKVVPGSDPESDLQ